MGIKKIAKKFTNKVLDLFLGGTYSQKTNNILKQFGMNFFNRLIICTKLEKISKNNTYFLSVSELDRLTEIFNAYNNNVRDISDSVFKPILKEQIKANETIVKFFDKIKDEIKVIPANASDLKNTHKKCCEVVDSMIATMNGMKYTMSTKKSRHSMKDYVNDYLGDVLGAKAEGGVYWDEFLEWIIKIVDQNLEYLGGLKSKLYKLKLPDEYVSKDQKKENDAKLTDKVAKELENIRKTLEDKYKDKEIENTGVGKSLSTILTKVVNVVSNPMEGAKGLANGVVNELIQDKSVACIELLGAIDSSKFNFLGFKLAAKIKNQLEEYNNKIKKISYPKPICYSTHQKMIEDSQYGILELLNDYIGIKGTKGNNGILKNIYKDYSKAVENLNKAKNLMKEKLTEIKNRLERGYGRVKSFNELRELYLINGSAIDQRDLKAFFKSIKNKKVMLFEQYAHEIYVLCDKSLKNLDKALDTEKLKVNVDMLEINTVKFDLNQNKFVMKDINTFNKNINTFNKNEKETQIRGIDASIEKYNQLIQSYSDAQKGIKSLCESESKPLTFADKDKQEKAIKGLKEEIEKIIDKYDKCKDEEDIPKTVGDLKEISKSLSSKIKDLEQKISNYKKISPKIETALKDKSANTENIEKIKGSYDKIWGDYFISKQELDKLCDSDGDFLKSYKNNKSSQEKAIEDLNVKIMDEIAKYAQCKDEEDLSKMTDDLKEVSKSLPSKIKDLEQKVSNYKKIQPKVEEAWGKKLSDIKTAFQKAETSITKLAVNSETAYNNFIKNSGVEELKNSITDNKKIGDEKKNGYTTEIANKQLAWEGAYKKVSDSKEELGLLRKSFDEAIDNSKLSYQDREKKGGEFLEKLKSKEEPFKADVAEVNTKMNEFKNLISSISSEINPGFWSKLFSWGSKK